METVATLSIDPPLPEHVSGDFLLVFAVCDGVANALSATGWTIGGQSVSGGTTTSACRAGWFYKIAASAAETITIATTTTTTTWVATMINIEGAHASTPIDVSNGNGITIGANPGTATPFQAASVDVVNANALVFWTMFNSLSTPSPFPGIRTISAHDTGAIGLGIGMLPQVATGASGTWDFYTEDHASTVQNSVSFTVAIRDAATPVYLPAYLDKTHSAMLSPFRGITASVRGEVNNATNTTLYTNMPAMGLKQSTKVFHYDDSLTTFYDVTTAANNAATADLTLFDSTNTTAVNDYIAFCMNTPFPSISLLCSTTGVGGVFVVEVLNGSTWTSLDTVSTSLICWKYWVTTTLTNKIDHSYVVGTVTSLYLTPAAHRKIIGLWKSSTLNSVTGYWMRIRSTTAPTTNPILSWIMPSEGIGTYDAAAALADSGGNPFHNSYSSTPAIHSATVSGPAGTFRTLGTGIAPYTPTGKLIIGTYTFGTARDYVDTGTRSELAGIAFYLTDASYRQRFYYVGAYQASDTYQNERNVFVLQWDAATQTYSMGNTALTEISRAGPAQNQIRGVGADYFNQLVAYGVPKLSGGTSGTPITNAEFLNTFKVDYYYPIPLIRTGVCVLPIQFGGGNALFLSLDALLLTFPRLTTEPNAFASEAYCTMHVDADYLGLIFDARAGDVCKIINSVISSDSSWRFEFTATASASATWDFSGTSVINAKVTLKNVTTFNLMTFSSCKSIDATGSTITNSTIKVVPAENDTLTTNSSTVISGSTINVTGVTAGNRWASVASPVIFASNTFTGSSTTGHAIRITSTTGSPFAFTGNTFTSFGPTVFGFHTTNDVNATTDVVTKTGHGYTTGDPIIYMKQGGAVNMGLTDATTYYVRNVTSSTISFHPTALDATNNTNITPLTSTGSETHYINSLGAAIFNDSAGAITINITSGGNTPSIRNGAGSSTNVILSVTVALTVVDESTNPIQAVQVYFQKSAAGKSWNYSSDAGNSAGDADFIVNEVIDADLPQVGWLHVWDASSNTKQEYRYASWASATKTFTLNAEVTGTADAGGNTTTLIDSAGNFTTVNIQEGDTIRNTTDTGAWAVVDEIVSATELTTSALQGGATNTWATGNTYSFHRLAIAYTDNNDLVDIPISNGQTNASGVISTTYNYSAYGVNLPVAIRVRSNTGATKYIPLTTSGTITASGYSGTVVLTVDTVAA